MHTATKLLLVALGLLVISTSALARDSHRKSSLSLGYSGGHNSHHSTVYLAYSQKRNHHYKKHYSYNRKHYSYNPYSTRSYGRHHNYQRNSYNNHYQKSCHPVNKAIVDRYGDYKNIGGTMCYDRYGQGYIVSGSRYLKH